MNRTTAILVALAALLAHVLAIHQNLDGTFAPPFEIAHVAYRAARNLVYDGTLAWNVGGPVLESYPSPLWVAISALFTRLYVAPTVATQVLGIFCALGTVVVLAQFTAERLAGLIALLLLVVTGTTAAAAGSGTELPLTMLVVTAAFHAYERRRARRLGLLLALLVVTRTELWILGAGLLAAELLGARRRRAAGEAVLLRPFLPFGVLVLASVGLRWLSTGTVLSPTARLFTGIDAEQLALGADYVASFFLRSGSAILIVFPLWYLVRGQLSGAGRRALALVALWSAFLVGVGGDGMPFWVAMVPILPLLFVAVQEALIIALDSRRPGLGAVTWALFGLAVIASGFVSRVPTDLGGLSIQRLHLAWMTPSERLEAAYGLRHGRRGLMQEIEQVEELRTLAVFMRDRLKPGTRILTPWPGAFGYLSRQHVVDLQGRATGPADGSAQRSWYGCPRLDLVAIFDQPFDYVVTTPSGGAVTPRLVEVVHGMVNRHAPGLDAGDTVGRSIRALRQYELVSVPVPRRSYRPQDTAARPFYLLRNRGLRQQPRLELQRDAEGGIVVLASHTGHQQVVDLEVELVTEQGVRRLRPTGEFVPDELVHARAGILLHATGQRPIQLMRFELPPGVEDGKLSAVLQNPSATMDPQFALVSDRAELELGPR